jgi:hypothetical protein
MKEALREMTIQARLKSRRNDGKDQVRLAFLRTAIAAHGWLNTKPRKQWCVARTMAMLT